MGRLRNLTNYKFERLVVIGQAGRDAQGRAMWLCKCDCGEQKVAPSRHLINGAVRSCGCLQKEVAAKSGRRGALKISGAKCHLYNHNLTDDERLNRRNLVEVREWRKAVYERDGYKCDICGKVGASLNAHHLNCWSVYPDQRFDVSNGITLCRADHKAFHDYMGGPRKECKLEDYMLFKSRVTIDREAR